MRCAELAGSRPWYAHPPSNNRRSIKVRTCFGQRAAQRPSTRLTIAFATSPDSRSKIQRSRWRDVGGEGCHAKVAEGSNEGRQKGGRVFDRQGGGQGTEGHEASREEISARRLSYLNHQSLFFARSFVFIRVRSRLHCSDMRAGDRGMARMGDVFRPLLMLWTAPPPAHECRRCGRC